MKGVLDVLPSWLISLVKWCMGIYCCIGVAVYYYQKKLIYANYIPFGSRTTIATPDQFGMKNYEEISLTSKDGTKIRGYWIPYQTQHFADNRLLAEKYPTLLYCHSNAGNMGHRLPIAKRLMVILECNIFMFSYRGYGKSEGEPSEFGIKQDAEVKYFFSLILLTDCLQLCTLSQRN